MAALAMSGAATAQDYGYEFRPQRTRVTPRRFSVKVEVFAWFDKRFPGVAGTADVWIAGRLDMVATDGIYGFVECPLIPSCPSPEPWIREPGRLIGVGAVQLHYPEFGIYGSTDNPILVLRVPWTAEDFTPRTVDLWSEEHGLFVVYTSEAERVDLAVVVPEGVVPASAVIHVTDCEADYDLDGELTIFDFLTFFNFFAAGSPDADCDGSRALDLADFLCFQNDFAAGCP